MHRRCLLFIHSSIDGQLGCLHLLTVNTAAMNMSVQISAEVELPDHLTGLCIIFWGTLVLFPSLGFCAPCTSEAPTACIFWVFLGSMACFNWLLPGLCWVRYTGLHLPQVCWHLLCAAVSSPLLGVLVTYAFMYPFMVGLGEAESRACLACHR